MPFMHRPFPCFPTGQVLPCSVPGRGGIGGRDECGAADCLGLRLRLAGDSVRPVGTVLSNLAVGQPSSSLTLNLWSSEGKRMGRWLPAKVTGKLGITDLSAPPLPGPTSAAGRCCALPWPLSLSRSASGAALCSPLLIQPPALSPVPQCPSEPPAAARPCPALTAAVGRGRAGARGRSGAGAVPEVTRRPRRGPAAEGGRRAGPRAGLPRHGPGPLRGGLGSGLRPAGEGVRQPDRARSGARSVPGELSLGRSWDAAAVAAGPQERSPRGWQCRAACL